MKISAKDSTTTPGKAALLAVLALEDSRVELPKGVSVGKGALEGFQPEPRKTRQTDTGSGPCRKVLVVGLGKKSALDLEALRRAAAIVVKRAEADGDGSVALWCPPAVAKALGEERAACALAEGARMGAYRFEKFKSAKTPEKLKSVSIAGPGKSFSRGVKRGNALGEANCFTRDLQNAPGNKMRPRDMAAAARALAKRSERITCKVISEAEMKRLGMGSLLSVSAGSSEPAYLIHLRYKPKARAKGRIAFVGKGLTFDAGGISIKPAAKMDEMKYDMSGGAAVLGAFHALGDLDVPYEVHGIVPTSENLPDAAATKPGDIVTAMNGTTIEVLNTDAEGRLILADALCYTVKKIEPDTIIDLATLTGAVIVALGHELSGIFPSTTRLRDDLIDAGEETGEAVWPLPLLDCHKEQMKGKVGDLRNINSGQGNGSTSGAAFLSSFVGDTEWCHIDIAGAAWGSVERDWVGGAAGSGVGTRLLMQYLETRA